MSDDSIQSLLAEGRTARYAGRPDVAHETFSRALELANQLEDDAAIAGVMMALAENSPHFSPEEAEQYADAAQIRQRLCQQALRLYQHLDDAAGQCRAAILLSTFDPEGDGAGICEQALALARELKNERLVARAARAMATHLSLLKETEQAAKLLDEAEATARRIGDRETLALVLGTRASQAEGADRVKFSEEAFGLCRQLGWKWDLAQNIITCVQLEARELGAEQSLELLREALAIAQELEDHPMVEACRYTIRQIADTQPERN